MFEDIKATEDTELLGKKIREALAIDYAARSMDGQEMSLIRLNVYFYPETLVLYGKLSEMICDQLAKYGADADAFGKELYDEGLSMMITDIIREGIAHIIKKMEDKKDA